MFTQSVQLFSSLSLGQFQDQPARPQVLPQRYWPDFEPFLNEFSQPDRRSGGLEGEVAKWQNRMTRFFFENYWWFNGSPATSLL